ncbi:MAG: sigma factor-like helix-turn-helix DNA-binding protein [bacterium]
MQINTRKNILADKETGFNYKNICQRLLKDLPDRAKQIIVRRFGLNGSEGETLEAIGKSYGITRERVRQIERDGFLKMKTKTADLNNLFDNFRAELEANGGLAKEEILLEEFGGNKGRNEVFFLLTLNGSLVRFGENKDFYSCWALGQDELEKAKKTVDYFVAELRKTKQPFFPGKEEQAVLPVKISSQALTSYLEASKIVQRGADGLFGLKEWPEINPRGVKDKAYLVLKKENTPLHFSEVAKRIGENALPQTVHNELIRDPRFVLVGRGLYALRSWGYEPGVVKDVIARILKVAERPLAKKEIIEEVLKQRLVKENTIALNLSDKNHFIRTPEGKYTIREI